MGASAERIALVIDQQKTGTGVRDTVADLAALEGRVAAAARTTDQLGARAAAANARLGAIPSEKIRSGANALAALSAQAQNAALGGQSATIAFGSLVQSLTLVASAGRFAGMAAGIGAVVTVALTLLTVFQRMNREVELTVEKRKELDALELAAARATLGSLDRKIAKLREEREERAAVSAELDLLAGSEGGGVPSARLTKEERQAIAERKHLAEEVAALETNAAKVAATRQDTLRVSSADQIFQNEQLLAMERLRARIVADGVTSAREEVELALLAAAQEHAAATRMINLEATRLRMQTEDKNLLAEQATFQRILLTQEDQRYDTVRKRIEAEAAAVESQRMAAQVAAALPGLFQRLRVGRTPTPSQGESGEVIAQREAELQSLRDQARALDIAGIQDERMRIDAEHQHRLELIEAERHENIKKWGDVEVANKNANAQIAAAERVRIEGTKKLEQVLVADRLAGYARSAAATKLFGKNATGALEGLAMAVKLYEIFPQAQADFAKGKSEGAASLASFGKGNIVGGALHGAASLAYFGAAATGFASAGMGGGSGGGSPGGGGAGGTQPVFEPDARSTGGGGGTTIILQTVNPFTGSEISRVVYELERGGQLDRPIPIGPTNGIRMATG